MATKRKKKSGSSKRRGRVSGLGTTATPILGAVLGAVGSKLITKAVGDKLDAKILAAVQIGASLFLIPRFVKGPLGAGIAAGVAATAGVSLVQDMGLISGVADFYRIPTINGLRKISGSAEQTLAGSAKQMLSGVDLVTKSADVRSYSPNYNYATNGNQMNVISGIAEFDESCYGID